MSPDLKERVLAALEADPAAARAVHAELLSALEKGEVRAAEPDGDNWRVNTWVKQGLLLGFRLGDIVDLPGGFLDKDTYPVRRFAVSDGVRLVPGGSAVRRGAYLARGVVCMPPMYVNVGAWVGPGTMIDSHALVGSCAQIGAGVHLSAAAQIGGVLEPPGALPVVVEDGAFVGGGCGVYEGVRVGAGAVLAAGIVLTRSSVLLDLAAEREIRAVDGVLRVPDRAVVVPGSRPAGGAFAAERGVSLYAPVVVKYRDARTDAATALEEALR